MIAIASAWFSGRKATGTISCISRPEQVERELRPGHVGHDQVEQARGEVQPRGLGEQRGRREVLEAGDHLGAQRLLGLLEALHRLAHDPQPLDRVLGVDGQRAAHRGDAVAERAVLVLGADRDRHQRRAARGPRCARRALRSQRPSAPATTASTTSLTVPPSAFLIALKSSSSAAHPAHPPVRADRHVERHLGRRVEPRPGHLADALGGLAHLAERAARAAARAPTAWPASSTGRAQQALDALGHQLGVRGLGLAASSRRSAPATPAGTGLEVEQHGGDVDAATRRPPARGGSSRSARSARPRGPGPARVSHSGLERSRRWEKIRPASWRSCSLEPGAGSAVWRTW